MIGMLGVARADLKFVLRAVMAAGAGATCRVLLLPSSSR